MRWLAPVEVGIEPRVRGHLGPGLVEGILIDDDRGVLGRKRHGRGLGLLLGFNHRTHVVAIAGLVGRPDKVVTPEDLGPEDALDARFQPVDEAVVGVGRGAGRVELGNGAARGVMNMAERHARALLDFLRAQVLQRRARRRDHPLAKVAVEVEGDGLLHDIDDLEAQGVAGLAVLAHVAQQLHEDAPLLVEGVQVALALVVPDRPKLAQDRVRVAIDRAGVSRAAILLRDGARELVVEDDVDGPDLGGRDGNGATQVPELTLGPVHGPGRLGRAAGDHVGGRVEEVDAGAVGDVARAAAGIGVTGGLGGSRISLHTPPCHPHGAGLDRIDLARMRAPIIARVRMAVGRVGLGNPVPLLEDVERLARLVEVRHLDHASERVGRGLAQVRGPDANLPERNDHVRPASTRGKLHVRHRVREARASREHGRQRAGDPVRRHGAAAERHPWLKLPRRRLVEATRRVLVAIDRGAAIRADLRVHRGRKGQPTQGTVIDAVAGRFGLDGELLHGVQDHAAGRNKAGHGPAERRHQRGRKARIHGRGGRKVRFHVRKGMEGRFTEPA